MPHQLKRHLKSKSWVIISNLTPSHFSFSRAHLLTGGLIIATVGVITLFATFAAGPFVTIEPENATFTPGATRVTDTAASGGQALQFGAVSIPPPLPPPTGERSCPAYPAFPDASCTGYLHTGVTLTNYTGPTTITTPGTVIDSKLINGDLNIQANNVTVRRSKLVGGRVNTGYSGVSGVLLEDFELDGRNHTYSGIGNIGFTCRRCNIYGVGQGIQATEFTVEDSYIHDLYGEGAVHSEAILGYSNNMVVRHSNLIGNYNAASGNWAPNDGGMSSAVSFYTHGDTWGPMNNVLFEYNRMAVGEGSRDYAGYCLYAGGEESTNMTFRHNKFVRHPQNPSRCGFHGTVVNFRSGFGNTWTNNTFEDGVAVNP